ncbi:hypothetical protein K2Y11_10720 [bacterium]|nr:hypothetical protein [bacterium]
MTKAEMIIQLVKQPVQKFLEHQLTAIDLVRVVDELVGNDRLVGLDSLSEDLVQELHEALALYVPDDATRREEPGIYIGEDDLRMKAAQFIAALEASAQTGL